MRVARRVWVALFLVAVAAPAFRGALADPPPAAFDVLKYDLAANQDEPELCFIFSGPLARQPSLPLESFVTTDPSTKLSAVPRNDRPCLAGFGFGSTYAVTLKAGLPGVSGALTKEAHFTVTVPNRPPAVAFAAGGELLPGSAPKGCRCARSTYRRSKSTCSASPTAICWVSVIARTAHPSRIDRLRPRARRACLARDAGQ